MAGLHSTSREDIVITGMSCRFAGVRGPDSLWERIMSKQSNFTQAGYASDSATLFGRTVPEYAAQLGELYSCNPADQYFPRKINAGENPDLFFAVQLVADALRDSGTSPMRLPTDRISLRLGYAPPFNTSTVNWLQHTYFLDTTLEIISKFYPSATTAQLEELRGQLTTAIPAPTPYSILTGLPSVTTSWIAHLMSFAGPATTLDAGAVSGIEALQNAMDDLLSRRADIALAGAIQPPFTKAFIQGLSGTYTFTDAKLLQPFSRDSAGTLPGEGGVFFVLKRLKDAQREGDRIYAMIRSTGIAAASLDQQRRVPTPDHLTRAISRSLHAADIAAESIQYVEAHGSGVPHSDMTELQCLKDIRGDIAPGEAALCIGSVKGNIGHTLWCSAAAGIAKVALALNHKVMPPQVQTVRPYQELYSTDSPLCLLMEPRPWLRGNRKAPRRALVSSIDFTGTCASAVLEEYTEAEK